MPPLSHVNPGDLITADFFNSLIDQLNSAVDRIEALEAAEPPTSGLAILDIVPDGPYRVGDRISVLGRDFQYGIGATRVFLGSVQVLNLLSPSSDTVLTFDIPAVPGLGAGDLVPLVVMNQSESTTEDIQLLSRAGNLQGSALVKYIDVQPATFGPGDNPIFHFRLQTAVSDSATWSIEPVIEVEGGSSSQWNQRLTVLNAAGVPNPTRTLSLDRDDVRNFGIQLNGVPNVANGTVFRLAVAASARGLSQSSGLQRFEVGVATEPVDETIELNPVPVLSGGALSGTTLTVPAGSAKALAINARFSQDGTYDVSIDTSLAASWTVAPSFGTPASFDITGASERQKKEQLLQYSVTAGAGAVGSGTISFTLKRQTALASQSSGFTVQLAPSAS